MYDISPPEEPVPQTLEAVTIFGRCSAKSKQTGEQCKHSAVPGATVCRYHGGAAPQVKEAARRRLATMIAPALARLEKLLKTRDDKVAFLAVRLVLESNGLKGPTKIELTGENGGPIQYDRIERIIIDPKQKGPADVRPVC